MKSIRITLLLFVLAATLLLVAGCDKHHVDVYINDEYAFVNMDNGNQIKTLWWHPGDYVSFNNISTDKEFTLEFPAGMFEKDKTDIIKPGQRVTLQVIAKEPMEGAISFDPESPIGNPDAKVGEGP